MAGVPSVAGMPGVPGRFLPTKSRSDPFAELPALIRGDPAAGMKLVPAAVNCGMPVMEAESKPEPAA